ncbi:MAG TPA: M24 family metallopeptidase [Phycisphaerae bacterium]|nr:M24 family metallopeptidase [Phycisphaerae bacterium]HRY71313.1 M24 family metallopeptidase [Phycisphaerae bacterium]HSA29701.1 M24 family metallopeptidase [Phycisphaerae bacterium]
MEQRVCIPEAEYQQRIQKAAALIQQRGLDVLVANSNEADYANVRYFSNFWPLFETAGVAISPLGKAALMVGPESLKYSSDRSMIQNIFQLMEYRESADPAYPELQASTFTDVFKSIGVHGKRLKIGVGGYLVSNPIQLAGLKECYPEAEIVRADDVMVALRSIKSENEIACIREGLRITEIATQEVIRHIQPGMTELQLVGIAQKTIYENGAEYEGLPMYVFSEKSTRHAISRSTYREIQKGDIVQLNLSAKVDGYSPSIGMPISMGRLTGRKKEIVDFGLAAHLWTYDQLKAGVVAADVARQYIELFKKRGYYDNYLYGPCHGTGLIEVESPWMESISNYRLAENMTFQVDTFVSTREFGIRWETGIVIRKDRAELLSQPIGKIFEIGV